MHLVINTNESEFYVPGAKPEKFDKMGNLPGQIAEYLKKKGIELASLKGVAVIQGKGSFSDTRHGAVFANILAYASGIPVLGLTQEEFKTADIEELFKARKEAFIIPEYAGEPNIG